jgi:hypothetical protein
MGGPLRKDCCRTHVLEAAVNEQGPVGVDHKAARGVSRVLLHCTVQVVLVDHGDKLRIGVADVGEGRFYDLLNVASNFVEAGQLGGLVPNVCSALCAETVLDANCAKVGGGVCAKLIEYVLDWQDGCKVMHLVNR